MREVVTRTIELDENDIIEIIAEKFGIDSEKVNLEYGNNPDDFGLHPYCNAKIVDIED